MTTGRERRDESSLDELDALARSAGLVPAMRRILHRQRPDPATFLGSGAVALLGAELDAIAPVVVLFDHAISAVQQRNLEQAWKRAVSDRTELIIDIFSQRARSSEGKLQVELARLEHQSSRLVRMWSHLERQRGGIGLRGGPGERQIELDRRLLGERIRRLRERLRKVERQRATRRRSRNRGTLPLVSLIGYTNAGKSTLFNRLTRADALTANQLFATLDPLTRRVQLAPPALAGDGSDATGATADADAAAGADAVAPLQIVVSDTVGFVRDLPHGLIAAFRSTLEETAEADLLLHVVDADAPDREAQIEAVDRVLVEIGAGHVPQWRVLNKVDRVGMAPGERRDTSGKVSGFAVSALTGSGVAELRRALAIWAAAARPAFGAKPPDSARLAVPSAPPAEALPGPRPPYARTGAAEAKAAADVPPEDGFIVLTQ